MSRAAVSILAFGIYLLSGGVLLAFFPAFTCHLLTLDPPADVWIRMTGMFFLLFGNYCLRAAFAEETTFIRWTVTTRPTTLIFLSTFVALDMVAPVILIFGVIDVAASVWTALALRADASSEPSA